MGKQFLIIVVLALLAAGCNAEQRQGPLHFDPTGGSVQNSSQTPDGPSIPMDVTAGSKGNDLHIVFGGNPPTILNLKGSTPQDIKRPLDRATTEYVRDMVRAGLMSQGISIAPSSSAQTRLAVNIGRIEIRWATEAQANAMNNEMPVHDAFLEVTIAVIHNGSTTYTRKFDEQVRRKTSLTEETLTSTFQGLATEFTGTNPVEDGRQRQVLEAVFAKLREDIAADHELIQMLKANGG